MRTFRVLVLCGLCLAVEPSQADVPSAAPPIVELKKRIELPVQKGDALQVQLFALEAVRGRIYGELEKECETLKATYQTDCRLKGAVMDGQILVDLGGIATVELVVTSLYELTQRGAAR